MYMYTDLYIMIHNDLQCQQTQSWVEHCLDIHIYTLQYHHRNTYLITNIMRSLMMCEYFDMRHTVNMYTSVITSNTHHVTFDVREAVVINSTLHHLSHGGFLSTSVTVRVTKLLSREHTPGVHYTHIQISMARPLALGLFFFLPVVCH